VWLVTKCQCRDSGLDIRDIYFLLSESSLIVPQFWKEETAVSVLEVSPLIGVAGLRLDGELDLATAPLLALLTFLDSSGLHAIIKLARSQEGDRSVVLVNPSTAVLRVLEIAGIDKHPAVEIRQGDAEPVAA
jgi:hypothetical protein